MSETNAPYLRIVDDVRQRITSGELRPGDRVPSARRITRDWGVAIATATRALAVLQREGLTIARPGVGTVVAGAAPTSLASHAPPSAPPSALPSALPATARRNERRDADGDRELTRPGIVRAAIALADAEGMAEVSMRRVAAQLGVATMSLYRHLPSKDDLVLHMIDAAIGEARFPSIPPVGWRARLELCARLQWRVFRRHPWLAPTMSLTRPQLAPNALAHAEWVLDAFDDTDLDLGERMYIHVMLFSYVRGIATALEPEADARRETGTTDDEWMESLREKIESLTTSNALATLLHLARRGDFDLDLDRLFEFGLARLLDGLELFQRRVPQGG